MRAHIFFYPLFVPSSQTNNMNAVRCEMIVKEFETKRALNEISDATTRYCNVRMSCLTSLKCSGKLKES